MTATVAGPYEHTGAYRPDVIAQIEGTEPQWSDAPAECETPEADLAGTPLPSAVVMTLAGPTYAEAMAWVEQLVADTTALQATKYDFYTLSGVLWVQVQGGRWEAHAWQAATGGRVMSPAFDKHRVRRQMIIGQRVSVEVIDDPRKRGESRG